jgi:hypothetical protein
MLVGDHPDVHSHTLVRLSSLTHPLLHEEMTTLEATHAATALSTRATTPQAPQLLALLVRSVSQPLLGSLSQLPHLQFRGTAGNIPGVDDKHISRRRCCLGESC